MVKQGISKLGFTNNGGIGFTSYRTLVKFKIPIRHSFKLTVKHLNEMLWFALPVLNSFTDNL